MSDKLDAVTTRFYAELRRIAANQLRREGPGHSLNTVDLVNEAYVRLAPTLDVVQSRTHYLSLAAIAMRRVLIDHARAKRAQKRGGLRKRVTLNENLRREVPPTIDPLDLYDALDALKALSERQAVAIEYQAICGMTQEAIAVTLGVSVRTVRDDLRMGRAWLIRRLEKGAASGKR